MQHIPDRRLARLPFKCATAQKECTTRRSSWGLPSLFVTTRFQVASYGRFAKPLRPLVSPLTPSGPQRSHISIRLGSGRAIPRNEQFTCALFNGTVAPCGRYAHECPSSLFHIYRASGCIVIARRAQYCFLPIKGANLRGKT